MRSIGVIKSDPRQLRPSEAPTRSATQRQPNPAEVVAVPVVVGERPLGDVGVQVLGSDVDLRTLDRTLQQAPEVV